MARDEPETVSGTRASERDGAGFERALRGLQETGASVDMRELVEQLAKHGAEEGRLLHAYEQLARTTADDAAKYLIDLIMDDERRHHRLLVEMATSMAWGSVGTPEGAVPALGWRLDGALLDATRRLREYEEQDRRELAALRKDLRDFEDSTLWGLIVEMMLLDTEKHAAILRFLERHSA